MNDSVSQEQASTEPTAQAHEVTHEYPGKRLCEARESRQLSREEVGHHLRLDPSLIRALEEDDYGKLPSPSYICGYLRSYARLLKLDEREIVSAYSKGQEISSALIPENINILPGKKHRYSAIKWLVVLILLASLIGAGLWLLERPDVLEKLDGTERQSSMSAPASVPNEQPDEGAPIAIAQAIRDAKEAGPVTVTDGIAAADTQADVTPQADTSAQVKEESGDQAGAQAEQNAAKPVALRMHFRDDSWTEILDGEGNRVIYRLVRKGANLDIDAQPPFTILLGNAPYVDVYFRDALFDHARFHRNEIAYFRIGNE